MGKAKMSFRIVAIMSDGSVKRLSVRWWDKVTNCRENFLAPEYAGMNLRIAMVTVKTQSRLITAVHEISGGCMPFDQSGKYRRDLFERDMEQVFYPHLAEMSGRDDFEKEYIRLKKLPLTNEERDLVLSVIGVASAKQPQSPSSVNKRSRKNMSEGLILTDEERRLILARRQEEDEQSAAIAFRQKAIATAHAFEEWSAANGDSLTFSTFIDTFNYQDHDGKQMYEAVKRIRAAAWPQQ